MVQGLQGDAQAEAVDGRDLAIIGWFNVEDEVREAGTSGIDAAGFAAALRRLKKEKNSPGGLTAEILQSLLLEQRAHLSTDVTRRMRSLDLKRENVSETWRAVQRMEPGVQRRAVGRAESVRSRSSTLGDGRVGASEPGTRSLTGRPRKPDNLLRNGAAKSDGQRGGTSDKTGRDG